MGPAYFTIIIMFSISQLVLGFILMFMTRERNRQQLRADRLRAEIFEQYRANSDEHDRTAVEPDRDKEQPQEKDKSKCSQ